MADYDFTIRATDTRGAYSDRTFTISVKNTNVERYCVLGDQGLAHSPTGLNGSWTVESGVTGRALTYGDGKWVVYGITPGGSTPLMIRTSSDTVNWNSYLANIPLPVVAGTTFSVVEIQCLKFLNGQWHLWVMLLSNNGSVNRYGAWNYVSNDLVTWERYTPTNIAAMTDVVAERPNVYDIDYDPITDRWIAVGTMPNLAGIWTRRGTGSWNRTYYTSAMTRLHAVSIMNINGQWAVNIGMSSNIVVSVDGTNWTAKPLGGGNLAIPSGMAYANGYLLVHMRTPSTSGSNPIPRSVNGGRTFVPGPGTTGPNGGSNATQTITAYGSTCLALSGTSNLILLSTDSGATYNAVTLPNGVGIATAVVARID